jgi:uncharacterized protein YbaP (TraB family)
MRLGKLVVKPVVTLLAKLVVALVVGMTVVVSTGAAGERPFSPTKAFLAQKPLENSLLWRVSGRGLKSASYLFGTMHSLCPQDAVLPAKVALALDSTAHVLMELDMDDSTMLGQKMAALLGSPDELPPAGGKKRKKTSKMNNADQEPAMPKSL